MRNLQFYVSGKRPILWTVCIYTFELHIHTNFHCESGDIISRCFSFVFNSRWLFFRREVLEIREITIGKNISTLSADGLEQRFLIVSWLDHHDRNGNKNDFSEFVFWSRLPFVDLVSYDVSRNVQPDFTTPHTKFGQFMWLNTNTTTQHE